MTEIDAAARRLPPRGPGATLREFFTIERPPPATAAVRRLRRLIGATALTVVLVELVVLQYVPDAGLALTVRTGWALLRAVGFLALMRAVRFGRLGARPFGLILAVTTMFAVVRLAVPRRGSPLPAAPVTAGFVVLALLCAAVVWQLYRSAAVSAHLTRRPPRRHIPPWVLTARVAALSFSALLLVPAVIAVGSLFGGARLPMAYAVPLVVGWLVFGLAVGFATPWISLVVVYGKRPARLLLAGLSIVVLVVQPALCLVLLGVDSLVRDGGPLMVAALLALWGLWRSRADPGGPVRAPGRSAPD
jgi:hypothetical protein